jgi:hypothetical protein
MDLGVLLRREVFLESAVGWWGRVGVLVSSGMESAAATFDDPNVEMDQWQNFAEDMSKSKKLIQIDITSDTVCPWCFIGKKYLEKAMEQVKDQYDFEVRTPKSFSFLKSLYLLSSCSNLSFRRANFSGNVQGLCHHWDGIVSCWECTL